MLLGVISPAPCLYLAVESVLVQILFHTFGKKLLFYDKKINNLKINGISMNNTYHIKIVCSKKEL